MRYFIGSDSLRVVDPLCRALRNLGNVVLSSTNVSPSTLLEIIRFDPDVIVIRDELPYAESPSARPLIDVARFGQRPVVALRMKEEPNPTEVGHVLLQPWDAQRLAEVARRLVPVSNAPGASSTIRCGDVEVDLRARMVWVRGEAVTLTFREFEVLIQLCENRGRVLSRRDLLRGRRADRQYRDAERRLPLSERSIDVQITRLREKLATAERIQIITVKKVGYRCDEDP